jgi:hypothetical protein
MMECNHYAEMWFLWFEHAATTAQNNHVFVVNFSQIHFNDYNHNCESITIKMTMITKKDNYNYIFDYTTNVTIFK